MHFRVTNKKNSKFEGRKHHILLPWQDVEWAEASLDSLRQVHGSSLALSRLSRVKQQRFSKVNISRLSWLTKLTTRGGAAKPTNRSVSKRISECSEFNEEEMINCLSWISNIYIFAKPPNRPARVGREVCVGLCLSHALVCLFVSLMETTRRKCFSETPHQDFMAKTIYFSWHIWILLCRTTWRHLYFTKW